MGWGLRGGGGEVAEEEGAEVEWGYWGCGAWHFH